MIINRSFFMGDSAELRRLLTAVALTFKTKTQLPESVDWFASWGQWKPLTVMVRLVSVYKSLCSLASWQVEIWQAALKHLKNSQYLNSAVKPTHNYLNWTITFFSFLFGIKAVLKLTKQLVNFTCTAKQLSSNLQLYLVKRKRGKESFKAWILQAGIQSSH